MTVPEFHLAYPHLNWIDSSTIVSITVNQLIPIANAIQITIHHQGRGVPFTPEFSQETGYVIATPSGFINNYMTFNVGNGARLLRMNNQNN